MNKTYTQTYLVETDNIVFVLKHVKNTFAWDTPVIQTEHTQLYLLTDPMYLNNFKTKNISNYNTNLLAYVNIKFVYIENIFKTSLINLYMHKCRNNTKTRMVYELPISHNNQTYFMAPKTHIIQKHGTQIDYNDLLPPAFILDDDWFAVPPSYKRPQTLKPNSAWIYKSPDHLMTAGIYNQDTMEISRNT